MNNDGSAFAGFPVWVKVIATVGLPSVLALFLVLVLVGIIPSPLTRVAQIEADLRAHHEQTQRVTEAQIRLLRAICRNTAKSDFWQEACER